MMGIHFNSLAEANAHLASLDWNKIPDRIQTRLERYADGTCLLLIHDPKGVD